MIVDALDDMDLKTGVRTDGTAFSLNGLGSKIGPALGSALGMAVIGWFGYQAGQDVTPHVQKGITIASNVIPAVVYLLAIIPVLIYDLKESDMPAIRQKLSIRNEERDRQHQAALDEKQQ